MSTLGEDIMAATYIGMTLGLWCLLDGVACLAAEYKRKDDVYSS